ncbi:MAG: hypothetical protein C0598_14150 [Marinilabiliales bacterium]|nr:MAG: hypothetical protein C0598_14150 [Marinilabiliales bacterium]
MIFASSCSVKKYIPEGKKITVKYSFKIADKPNEIKVSDLRTLTKPQPNSRFLGMHPKLYVYFKYKKKGTKFAKWLNERFGEEPVYTTTADLNQINKKLKAYLADIGFFNAVINYIVKSRKFKNEVQYKINSGTPYRISNISYDINDSLIRSFVNSKKGKSLLKKKDVYNAFTMDDERDRITKFLRDVGYYRFSRNYIQFIVDSTNANKTMDVTIKINNIKQATSQPGKFLEKKHKRYFINKVEIKPDYRPLSQQNYDTTQHKIDFWDESKSYNYHFLYADKIKLKPSAFDQAIKIKPGKPYSSESIQKTYNRLFSYRIIRSVNISFDTLNTRKPSADSSFLDCKINMQKNELYSFTIAAEGTNSSGDLGMRGNIILLNNNIFKRAEVLRLAINGGFEAQTISETDGNSGIFNTFEAGVQSSIFFPRFFSPVRLRSFNQRYNPTSNISFGFNYQLRPNYSRNISRASIGYSWNNSVKIKQILTPVNINFVKVNPTPEFEKILEEETNKRLKEQYSDHMILGLNYSIIFSNQETTGLKNFEYFRANIETSGNLLYGLNSLFGSSKSPEGYYELVGVRYSQYVRADFDFRQYYMMKNRKSSLATRIYVGLGLPYLNSEEIPYERGFYAGGANGMRGWAFRTLGPGSFNGTDQYERIGDIHLEYNLEYRFPIYNFFHGAIFADLGNIWTYNQSETFPNGQFKFNRFYKEIATDLGFGFRFDFQFFIFRIDFAAPIVDPSYPEGERWRFDYLQFKNIVGNFGIGYPF